MYLVRVIFVSKNGPSRDDVITITPGEGSYFGRPTDVYDVAFKTSVVGGGHTTRHCFMNARGVEDYVETVLDAVRLDEDPCEHVQVDSAMAPSVLYDSGDLECGRVRSAIRDVIRMSLHVFPQ